MRLWCMRSFLLWSLACCAALLASRPVHASGPVERLLQVMVDPTDPQRVLLRFGAASEGFLYSEDGGRSFRVTCTEAIEPGLTRISSSRSVYLAPSLLDADGHLLVNTFDALWSDDGEGCSWTKEALQAGQRIVSMQVDPAGGEVLAIANTATGMGDAREARSELIRRGAGGSWASVGLLRPHVATQRAFGADLVAVASAGGRRLYASVTVSVGPASAPQQTSVVVSDDGGQNWRQGNVLPQAQETLTLLAGDPLQPDRLLAVVASTGQTDQLLLSNDQGKTFSNYAELEEVSGVAFAPDGRIFVGDAGGGVAAGAVWSAPRLGEALSRLPAPSAGDTPSVDCIGFDAQREKLLVCKVDRFGLLDPESGAFEELTRFEAVAELLDCAGKDLRAACEAQFNEGASWCCSGHFPFSGFCGGYDVTQQNGMPVACGLSGRTAELAAGRGPTLDAGIPDAGSADAGPGAVRDAGPAPAGDAAADSASDARARRKSGGGCALARTRRESGALDALFAGLCAFALVAARTRKVRAHGVKSCG
jgi:hypothetical protein